MKKYFIILTILLFASGCGKTQPTTSNNQIPPLPSQMRVVNSPRAPRDSLTLPLNSVSKTSATQTEQVEPRIYKYAGKTVELVDNKGLNESLYITDGKIKNKIFTSCNIGYPGCDSPILGTTTLPNIVHLNVSAENGEWDSIFIDLNSQKTLEYYVGDEYMDYSTNTLFVNPDPITGIKSIGYKFVLMGSCLKNGKMQYDQKLVKVTGVKIITEFVSKELKSDSLSYTFVKPVQLTCVSAGTANYGGYFKEIIGMSVYSIHADFKQFGIMAKGKDLDGNVWQYIFGFDMGKQAIIPWAKTDKGFGYEPHYILMSDR